MSTFSLPLSRLVHENLSVIVDFCFSRATVNEVMASFLGEWKYLRKTVYDVSEARAEKVLGDSSNNYLLDLRRKIGTPLITMGAGALIIDEQQRVLLGLRGDNRLCGIPAGQMELGETPAGTAIRETYEEIGLRIRVTKLMGVYTGSDAFHTYPDGNLVELLLLLDAARGLGADKITCVIPYFGYARQDRRFNPGEALSAKVMLRHLEMEMDRLLTIDLHKPDVLEWFARAPALDLKAAPAIGEFFGDYRLIQNQDQALRLRRDVGDDQRRTHVLPVACILAGYLPIIIKSRDCELS